MDKPRTYIPTYETLHLHERISFSVTRSPTGGATPSQRREKQQHLAMTTLMKQKQRAAASCHSLTATGPSDDSEKGQVLEGDQENNTFSTETLA